MEIFDTKGEYDEIFIAMLIKDYIQPFQVKGKIYLDENPFEEIGNRLIDNGLENGEVLLNDSNKCIIYYDNDNYKITYNYLNNENDVIYTINKNKNLSFI